MPTINVLTDVEYRHLTKWMFTDMPQYFKPGKYERNHLAMLLMLDCGLRVGELVKLKWKYFQGSESKSTYLRVPAHITKTNSGRDIPLPENVFKALKCYEDYNKRFNESCFREWLFPRAVSSDHITTRNIQFITRFIGLAALHKEIHCHLLRHTFATRLLRVTNLRIVQSLMGHKKLTSTQIYTHPDSNDLRKAIDKMACH